LTSRCLTILFFYFCVLFCIVDGISLIVKNEYSTSVQFPSKNWQKSMSLALKTNMCYTLNVMCFMKWFGQYDGVNRVGWLIIVKQATLLYMLFCEASWSSRAHELPSSLVERVRYVSLVNRWSFYSNERVCTVSSSSSGGA